MSFLKKKKPRKYCGLTAVQMEEILIKLCEIEDSVGLSDQEQDAMDIAIQAISDLHNAMIRDGKIHWEWSE